MDNQGFLHATEVVEGLLNDKKVACICALKFSQDGQKLLGTGEFETAIKHFIKAEQIFNNISSARYLLGICKADIAAAYGNLGKFQKAFKFAKESIAIIGTDHRFTFTLAAANMTAGFSSYRLGEYATSAQHLKEARRLWQKIPGGEQYLSLIDQNDRCSGTEKVTRTSDMTPIGMWLIIAATGCIVLILLIKYFARS
jgi:tetratricopeptide (TPR) repeat protein